MKTAKNIVRVTALLGLMTAVSACSMPTTSGMNSNPQPMYAGGAQPQMMTPAAPTHGDPMTGGTVLPVPTATAKMEALANSNSILQMQNKILSEMDGMQERVRRVERALIRLDRRMQLVEKNELSRMSGMMDDGSGPNISSNDGAQYRPMSMTTSAPAPQAAQPMTRGLISNQVSAQPVQRTSDGARFQTVSHTVGTSIRDVEPSAGRASVGVKSMKKLPSLADDNSAPGLPNGGVKIWTLTYMPNKVWPSREQLAGAADLIEDLKAGKKVTIFARGQQPSSNHFKERLQAISRYLSDVAQVDSISIAAMPAEHIPSDTIEIIATQ